MKVLFIDNSVDRHKEHQSFIDKNPKILILLTEKMAIKELESDHFDIYVVHRGNDLEYKYIYDRQLGKERIIFSGAETNPEKTEMGIFSNTRMLYKYITDAISKNS